MQHSKEISRPGSSEPQGEQIAAERQALLDAIDSISEGAVICDAEGKVVYETNAVQSWLESSDPQRLGISALREVLTISRYGRRNTRSVDLLGPPTRSLVITGTPIVGADQKPVGALAVIQDATESRHQEAMLRDFVADISHELKTPVGALSLLADALMVEKDSGDISNMLERMQREALRVSQVIEDLLNLSGLQATGDPARQPVPVDMIISQARAGTRWEAERKNISIEVAIKGEPVVFGSLRQLVSAAHHLLENAVKFSPEGSTVLLSAVSDGHWTDLSFHDQGPGIPAEYVDRVFERFFRVDDVRERGTGLGLAIVRQVIQRHGGEVRVSSFQNQGTTFFVRLPSGPSIAGQRRVIEGGEDG